ncbi:MAG: NAD(P)-dependent oxidoreductase, partial [Pseudomonadota bacterium]
ADVADPHAMLELTRDAYAVIHMGGIAKESDWDSIQRVNIGGTINLYEAARANGVGRIIVPSSNHAVGFYPRSQTIGNEVLMRPDTRYGVSKAFAELTGSLYADKYGIKTLAIRLGNVALQPMDRRRLALWISPRDLQQQIDIGLEHPDLHFAVIYGVSGNTRSWYDDQQASALGYQPLDNAETYAEAVIAATPEPDPDSISDQLQGGDFCTIESGGGAAVVK